MSIPHPASGFQGNPPSRPPGGDRRGRPSSGCRMPDAGCSRRQVLRSLMGGSLLMPGIVSRLLADDVPHRPAKAKQVILLYMSGGVSHLDTFDPKPKLIADHGRPIAIEG